MGPLQEPPSVRPDRIRVQSCGYWAIEDMQRVVLHTGGEWNKGEKWDLYSGDVTVGKVICWREAVQADNLGMSLSVS